MEGCDYWKLNVSFSCSWGTLTTIRLVAVPTREGTVTSRCRSAPFLMNVTARVFYQTPSTSPSNSARAFDTDGCEKMFNLSRFKKKKITKKKDIYLKKKKKKKTTFKKTEQVKRQKKCFLKM